MKTESGNASPKTQPQVPALRPKVEATAAPSPRAAPGPPRVVPSTNTLRVQCRYCPMEAGATPGPVQWDRAEEVRIDRHCTDGAAGGPVAYVRLLWTDTDLWFHVEVEEAATDRIHNNDEKVWLGNNIELLLLPRWFSRPFYDEYEFLFNSTGGLNELHWEHAATLETAAKWKAAGLRRSTSRALTFHPDKQGWCLQVRLPFKSLRAETPRPGDYWGLGLYRKHYLSDGAQRFLAWSPTFTDPPAFHVPSRLGMMVFAENAR